MQSPQMPLSCVPCAKRKVRCDRTVPCSHCRRRRGDICDYPIAMASSRNTFRRMAPDSMQSEQRIERLEQYIRSLGHDPDHVVAQGTTPNPTTSKACIIPKTVPEDILAPSQNTKRQRDGLDYTATASSRNSEQARLVQHDEQTTYVEAPLWHSWSEANGLASQSFEPPGCNYLGFCNTLMDTINTEDTAALYTRHPSAEQVTKLWKQYLSNIHPMTKLFFDWEKEHVLLKAADNPQALTKAEQAFSFAVYFISILSLSEEECRHILGDSGKPPLLADFQSCVETALLAAGLITTSDLLVLQAFLLYLLAIRNRARPAALFSLMGIAVRIGQRMGLHRDGSLLDLPPVKAEEKRRVWWHMQHMDIMLFQVLGCLSMTLYAEWDTKLPANLDDQDFSPEMEVLPPDRYGLTSISHCLWRYHILYEQRLARHSDKFHKDFAWLTSPRVSVVEKEAYVERVSRTMGEKFVQHCELLNPLHVSIQIGIRSFILAIKRIVHQPGVANMKISNMPKRERDEFLRNTVECLEYYILGETTPSIAQFRWHNENYFQWPAFVYVIIEARHRAATGEASALWSLINKVCNVHPKLVSAPERPDIIAIGQLIVFAWTQHEEHLRRLHCQIEKPSYVAKMEKYMNVFVQSPNLDMGWDPKSFMTLDLDMIDWSTWERAGYAPVMTNGGLQASHPA